MYYWKQLGQKSNQVLHQDKIKYDRDLLLLPRQTKIKTNNRDRNNYYCVLLYIYRGCVYMCV